MASHRIVSDSVRTAAALRSAAPRADSIGTTSSRKGGASSNGQPPGGDPAFALSRRMRQLVYDVRRISFTAA